MADNNEKDRDRTYKAPDEKENMPRDPATDRERQGQWGRPQDDERVPNTPGTPGAPGAVDRDEDEDEKE